MQHCSQYQYSNSHPVPLQLIDCFAWKRSCGHIKFKNCKFMLHIINFHTSHNFFRIISLGAFPPN